MNLTATTRTLLAAVAPMAGPEPVELDELGLPDLLED